MGTEHVLARLHLVSRSLGLPARAAFEVAAAAWCADGAGTFQPAEYPGLKDLLFLHVVPKTLMKRKDALVVSALHRVRRCSSIPQFCHSFAVWGDHRVVNQELWYFPCDGFSSYAEKLSWKEFSPTWSLLQETWPC